MGGGEEGGRVTEEEEQKEGKGEHLVPAATTFTYDSGHSPCSGF